MAWMETYQTAILGENGKLLVWCRSNNNFALLVWNTDNWSILLLVGTYLGNW